jgi:hypothetical protein
MPRRVRGGCWFALLRRMSILAPVGTAAQARLDDNAVQDGLRLLPMSINIGMAYAFSGNYTQITHNIGRQLAGGNPLHDMDIFFQKKIRCFVYFFRQFLVSQ